MGLRDIGATLPPGFRFYPSDEELVCHYLFKKIANEDVLKGTLIEIDLHTCEPWQLPGNFLLISSSFSFMSRNYICLRVELPCFCRKIIYMYMYYMLMLLILI